MPVLLGFFNNLLKISPPNWLNRIIAQTVKARKDLIQVRTRARKQKLCVRHRTDNGGLSSKNAFDLGLMLLYILLEAGGGQPGLFWGAHERSVDQEGNLYAAEVFHGRTRKSRPSRGADSAKLIAPFAHPARKD